jgi:hypothetical protein
MIQRLRKDLMRRKAPLPGHKGPTPGGVIDTVERMSREDLEELALSVMTALYLGYDGWDPDNEWSSDNIEVVAQSIPDELHAAVRVQQRLQRR